MGVSKNRGKNPKIDGENNGKPYFLMDDLGGNPLLSETSMESLLVSWQKNGTASPHGSSHLVYPSCVSSTSRAA